jgi:putative ABC transport system permease protein
MEFGPIWRSTLRNRVGPLLICVQIALTLAVIVNAIFIIQQRMQKINRPTGMDIDNVLSVVSRGFSEDYDVRDNVRQDLEALESIPGVIAATHSQHVPLSGSGWGTRLSVSAEKDAPRVNAAQYFVGPGALEALGLRLESGRGFSADDIEYPENFDAHVDKVIVTRAYLDALFPEGAGPGAVLYDDLGRPRTVIGVLEQMHGAWVDWDKLENVMLVPTLLPSKQTTYIIRAEPGRRDAVMAQVEETLVQRSDRRVIRDLETLTDTRDQSYMGDRGMAVLLAFVTALMVAVTGVGIVGLASFAVRQRVKQIGTRRAVGARRADIIRYFLLENWMITTGGVGAGALMAIAINYWLAANYSLERLDPWYLPMGMAGLWALGLLAVAGPARRAAGISPAVATRTV